MSNVCQLSQCPTPNPTPSHPHRTSARPSRLFFFFFFLAGGWGGVRRRVGVFLTAASCHSRVSGDGTSAGLWQQNTKKGGAVARLWKT